MKLKYATILPALACVSLITSCSDGGGSSNSATSTKPSTSSSTTSATSSSSTAPAQAKTLEAAVKAQQEVSDRFTSGDYEGAWDGYSSAFQKGISRSDYDQLGKTCVGASGSNSSIKVEGVRLEGADQAVVRLVVGDVKQARTMTYENGAWKQEPNPDFSKELGKPLKTIIADEKAQGACTGGN